MTKDTYANDMQHKLDACTATPHPHAIRLYAFDVSDHDYYYAAGIGDAWSVHVSQSSHFKDGTIWSDTMRKPGVAYNYGIGKPRYPVPALASTPMVNALNAPYFLIVPAKYAWDGIWR